jgi:hypothetical protein
MSEFDQGMNNAPDITLGEALEEIRQLRLAGETLRRERDEARAAVTTANSVVAEWQRDMEKAEARGYERGAREAAYVANEFAKDRMGTLSAAELRAAILALLEPVTLQEPEA